MKQYFRFLSRNIIRLFLMTYAVIVIAPIFWAVMTSFKTNKEFYKSVWALPENFNFNNYVTAWQLASLDQYIVNSIIIVGITVLLTMILSATTSYAIGKFKFCGNKFFSSAYMSGLLVPLVLGTIPVFFVLQNLNLYNTRIGLIIVYTVYSLPFSVFVLTGFFRTIPSTFREAAHIDGCSELRIFWQIMFPLAKSGIITVSIFNFLWTWNDYIYAMTFVPANDKRTLPVGLVKLTETATFRTDWGALFAGLTIVMVPSIIVYIFFQSQLTKGLTAGGIKG